MISALLVLSLLAQPSPTAFDTFGPPSECTGEPKGVRIGATVPCTGVLMSQAFSAKLRIAKADFLRLEVRFAGQAKKHAIDIAAADRKNDRLTRLLERSHIRIMKASSPPSQLARPGWWGVAAGILAGFAIWQYVNN